MDDLGRLNITSSMMFAPSVTVTAVALLGLAVAYSVTVFRRWQRLSHIPGPPLASLTDFWVAIKIWRGQMYHEFIQDLHAIYGPVVRFGPNRVSFSRAEAVADIYGTSHVYPKAVSYTPMIMLANGQEITTIITLRDEKRVSEIKKYISAGFSHSTWLKQEDQINDTIDVLLDQMRKREGSVVPLNNWLSFWSFDTLTNLAFSDTRGFLQAGKDLDNVFPSSRKRFAHWRTWSAVPWLEDLLYKNKYAQASGKTGNPLATLAMQRIKERKTGENNAAGRDLLGRYLAASQQAPNVIKPTDVLALTISTIHAGSETTAISSSLILINLLSTPQALAKLEDELQSAGLTVPPAYNDVDKLPYLDAVIHESLRLMTNPNCTERTVSPNDTEISGTFIPAGTDVSIAEVLVARDTSIYGPDANTFRPERWLDVDKARKAEMDRAAFSFSYGRRVCTGQHLAMIEMKKLIASLILTFKLEPVEVGLRGWEQAMRNFDLDVRMTPRI